MYMKRILTTPSEASRRPPGLRNCLAIGNDEWAHVESTGQLEKIVP
jgi:hypothetical protein